MTDNEGEQAADKPPAKRTRLKRSTKKAPAEKPSEKATEKAAADEPTSTPEESADKPADKPAEKSAEKPAAAATTTTATKTEPKEKKRSSKSVGATARQAFDLTRDRIGRLVGLLCLLAAAFLAVGALLIALRANINGDNPVVRFIIDTAGVVDGPLSRANGIFHFDGKNAMTKNALVNWGLAAIVWLIVGRILSRLIRP